MPESEEWFAHRSRGLSASVVGAALGVSSHTSRAAAWRRYAVESSKKRKENQFKAAAMQHGIDTEPEAAWVLWGLLGVEHTHIEERWTKSYPQTGGKFDKYTKHWKATIDRLLYRGQEIVPVEIKCPYSKKEDIAPRAQWIAQLLFQLRVWGMPYGYLWIYQGDDFDSKLFRVDNDDDVWKDVIFPRLITFQKYVERKQEPPRVKSEDKKRITAALNTLIKPI